MESVARKLDYTVNREFNRNMSVEVSNGQMVVNAPWYLSNKKIQKIIDEKSELISNKINECAAQKRGLRHISINGKKYAVLINYKNIKAPELNLEKCFVVIDFPMNYRNFNQADIVESMCLKLYDKLACKNIEGYMEKIRIQLGFAPEDYEIKRMKGLYAKCDGNNKIYINPEIMQFDSEVIEYIILHQFCHLKYKIHSKGFIELFEKNCPNHWDIEERLGNIKF